jgi:hypothetical protein
MKHGFPLAVVFAALSAPPALAETVNCTNLTALPATITVQGVYCLKQDLAKSMTSGKAITIATNNVTIDLNGFKLGGLAGGPNTQADGIYAMNRMNITIRNGTVRGFSHNIRLSGTSATSSSGHMIEGIRSEGARYIGISVQGSNSTVRNNLVFAVGDGLSDHAYGIVAQLGSGLTVEENDVSGVVEASQSYGIYTSDAPGSVVLRNIVRGIVSSNSIGIYSGGIVRDNLISNETIGEIGVAGEEGSSASCIDNVVRNFQTAFSLCGYANGNRSF